MSQYKFTVKRDNHVILHRRDSQYYPADAPGRDSGWAIEVYDLLLDKRIDVYEAATKDSRAPPERVHHGYSARKDHQHTSSKDDHRQKRQGETGDHDNRYHHIHSQTPRSGSAPGLRGGIGSNSGMMNLRGRDTTITASPTSSGHGEIAGVSRPPMLALPVGTKMLGFLVMVPD